MFGIWRTVLSIEVVAFHLMFLPFIGAYAVFSFFVLSGFLMTAIVHGTYGYGGAGFRRYLANRALRLYPSYWLAVTISLILIAAYGASTVAGYHAAISVPATPAQWAENMSMIFPGIVPREVTPRLVPLAWALTVEIVFYVLIGLGLSSTRTSTLIWLVVSLCYVVAASGLHHRADAPNETIPIYLYSAIPAGSLPFSVGAMVWHWRDDLYSRLTRVHLSDARVLVGLRWILYLIIATLQALLGWTALIMVGNWVNIALSGLIVCALFFARPSPPLRSFDKKIGDFSYPIYLMHLQMGLVATMLLFGGVVSGRSLKTLSVFLLALILTVALGAISVWLIDPVVEKLRTRIKTRGACPILAE